MLHAFFGVSRVPFSLHFWGSLLGYILPLLLVSFFGPRLFDAMRAAPPSVWIGMGIGVLLLALFAYAYKRRRCVIAR